MRFHFFAALLYRLSRGDSIPIVKYPPKKFETSSAVAPMAKLDQILPCTSESHPHPPIRSLARAMGVTMGEPQNFADSIAVVLVRKITGLIVLTSAFGASGLMFGWHVHTTDHSGTAPPPGHSKKCVTWVCIQNHACFQNLCAFRHVLVFKKSVFSGI